MKKLFLVLLFVPLVSFGQEVNNSSSTDIKVETNNLGIGFLNKMTEGEGISSLGDGTYKIQQTGKTFTTSYKKILRMAKEKIESYSKGLDLNFQIINEEQTNVSIIGRTIITFKLFNKDGTIYQTVEAKNVSKDKAKKDLLELKGFLDLGIITQEEFDKKAVELKKILLGN